MIAGWLAGKVSGIVIFCIACLSVVLIPAVVVQTVRIDGLDIGGWYLVDGYRPQLLAMRNDAATLRLNNLALTSGIATCNLSVDMLRNAGAAATAAANAKVAQAKGERDAALAAKDRMRKIKSTDEVCSTADKILRTGLE